MFGTRVLLLVAAVGLVASSCGGRSKETGQEPNAGSGGAAAGGSGGALDAGSDVTVDAGGGFPGSVDGEGGYVVLTDEQVDALESSVCFATSCEDCEPTCEFTVPPALGGIPLSIGDMNVIVDPVDGETWLILRSSREDCTHGWRLTDEETIELCPETCDVLWANPSALVQLLFGC